MGLLSPGPVAGSMVNANHDEIPWKPIGLDTSEPMVSANRASSNRTLVGNSSSGGGHEKKHTVSVLM